MALILAHQIGVTRVAIVSCHRPLKNAQYMPANASGTLLGPDEGDRKFLIRRAQQWTKLAKQKEVELRASARTAAKRSVNPEPGFLFVAGQR
jgi:hypothetical protein